MDGALLFSIARFVTLCVVISAPLTAQDTRPAILDEFIENLASRGQFSGAILIAEDGEVLFEKAIGPRTPDPEDSLTLGSQFRLASASKPFTALAIIQLREAGLLRFDDPVELHLSEWPYKGMTIRNLLTHTAGVPDVRPLFEQHWKPSLKPDNPERIVEGNPHLLKMLLKYRPDPPFKPGEKYGYSDTGYELLAVIVERVSGLAFHRYLEEKIFSPSGMTRTSSVSPLREDPLVERARGMKMAFDGSGMKVHDVSYLNSLEGADVIYSTVGDLYRWDIALRSGQLASPEGLAEAYAPAVLTNGERTRYGFGWSLYDSGSVSHDGYAGLFGAWINRHIEQSNSIFILTNGGMYLWGGIIQGLKKILKGEDYQLPKINVLERVGRIAVINGIDSARSYYLGLRRNMPGEYEFGGPPGLVALAHFLMQEDHTDEASFMLQFNTEQYPQVPFVWNAWGNRQLTDGDTTGAIESFHKSLSIDKDDSEASEMIRILEGTD